MPTQQTDGPVLGGSAPAATRNPIEDIYPLTRMQRGLLFRCVSYSNSPIFMGQWWALLEGALDCEALAQAWQAVVDRHPVLRTSFNWEIKDRPFQVVHRSAALSVQHLDWSGEAEWRQRLEQFLAEDQKRPFSLKRPPLLRVYLIRLADDRHLLSWTRHHLVVDGWSLGVILQEVFTIYAARRTREDAQLEAALPYRRYVEWEGACRPDDVATYWRSALSGFEAETSARSLVFNPNAPAVEEVTRRLSSAEWQRLISFARQHRLTINTLVQGAWGLVLARHSGRSDVLAGSVETLRPPHLLAEHGALIGMQITVLPVRFRIDETPLQEWLLQLQAAMVAGRDAGPIGFDDLRRIINVGHDALPFESLVGFQNYPLDEKGCLHSAGLTLLESGDITLPDMPLNLMAETLDGGLILRLMADGRSYSGRELQRLLDMLAHALTLIPANPDRAVMELDPVPPGCIREVLTDCCAGPPLQAPRGTLPESILAQAASQPGALAIRQGDQSLTYGELLNLAQAVADLLRDQGIGAGARIGVMLEPSPLAIAAILGALLRGGSYVPLDGNSPRERRDQMIAAAGISVVLTSRERQAELRPGLGVALDGLRAAPNTAPACAKLTGEEEAYVIFTSGSTGEPKGVSVTHDNLAWHVAARAAAYPDHPIDAFLLTFPLIFDGSVTVVFNTLASGGTLVLPRQSDAMDADRLVSLIAAAGVTHTAMTPSLWRQILQAATSEQLAGLHFSLVAGESCPRSLVTLHASLLPEVPLFNEYGPTEATVWTTFDRCRPEEGESVVPIGRPIPGCTAYVVDSQGRLCLPGMRGELFVAGPMVAQGYVGQAALTDERFGQNPFSDQRNAARLYRTGDLVSFGDDGRLRFHGRADRQVKLNGYRIELGEVEAALGDHPAVSDCIVLLRNGGEGGAARLVAHVAGSGLPEAEALRQHLAERLPAWMVPQSLVLHEKLPRSPNGKIDTTALHDPLPCTLAEPPKTDCEKRVAAIWAEALAIERVGRQDNFFVLGGSSLLAMQVLSRLRREGASTLELTDLFEAPCLADFALRVEASGPNPQEAAPPPSGPALRSRTRTRVSLPGEGA